MTEWKMSGQRESWPGQGIFEGFFRHIFVSRTQFRFYVFCVLYPLSNKVFTFEL